jgi:transcription elongation factor Elf1
MLCATAPGYNLTFRCINCGRHEASTSYRSDGVESEDQIKMRIYRVNCAACGWKGEACGLAAIRISPVVELVRNRWKMGAALVN